MKEPDLMFLDPATILFYTLCVVSFIAGACLISWLFPFSFLDRRFETKISPLVYLLAPLFFGIAGTMIINLYLVTHFPVILLALLSQHGEDIKDTLNFANDTDSHLAFVPLALTGIIWWALWRCSDLRLRGWRKLVIGAAIVLALLSVLIFATLIVNRGLLILSVGGIGILLIAQKVAKNQMGLKLMIISSFAGLLSISILFILFAFLRGTVDLDDQIHSLLGYTVASYNRLAGIVNGEIRYPFSGRGIYLSGVLAHSHALLLSQILNPPDSLEQWGSEFGAISQAGLDGSLIWSGAFG